jgi:hypothetical protein
MKKGQLRHRVKLPSALSAHQYKKTRSSVPNLQTIPFKILQNESAADDFEVWVKGTIHENQLV